MAAIHSKNTSPELEVRSLVHRMGFRFRLHRRDLPGTPDLVFPTHGKVIFIHGCFWHRHLGCKYATSPKTRKEYWQNKFSANVQRDLRTKRQLAHLGWRVLTVWQCELKKPERLVTRLEKFLAD